MSRRIKVIVPIPMDEAGVANRRAQLAPSDIAPGYEVDFVAVEDGAALGDSYYDTALMDWYVFRAGLRAEREGYDAVCVDTVSDSGVAALRSALSIPVVGPGQSSFHLACTLGRKFSVVTMWRSWFHLYEKLFDEHALWPRVASIRHIDTRPDTRELLAGKEEVIFGALERECRGAIDEDDADVIVLGSTTMHQSHAFLRDRLPVPVVNPGVVAYKTAELLLEMGLSQSPAAYPPPEVPNDAAVLGPATAGAAA
jgi:allantoin racemase